MPAVPAVVQGARPSSQSERRSPLLRLLRRLQGGSEGGAGRPGSAGEGDAEQWDALKEIEAAFLQSWKLEDTIRALNAGQKPTDAEVLRSWLLQHRAHTLDAFLADPSQRRSLGQAAVDDRNRPLLELLLEEPSFSAQGEGRLAPCCESPAVPSLYWSASRSASIAVAAITKGAGLHVAAAWPVFGGV